MKLAAALSGAILATVLSAGMTTGAMAQSTKQTTEQCNSPAMKQDPRCVGTAPTGTKTPMTQTNRAKAMGSGKAETTGVDVDTAACAKPSMAQDPRCVGHNQAPPKR